MMGSVDETVDLVNKLRSEFQQEECPRLGRTVKYNASTGKIMCEYYNPNGPYTCRKIAAKSGMMTLMMSDSEYKVDCYFV